MTAVGSSASAVGTAAAVTIVGAPEGAAALAGGAATATAGEAIAGLGAMMMANAADNAKDGYDRGKQNTSSDNSNNAPVNGETASTKKGKEEHKKYNPGPDYKLNSRLPSGKRPDAYSLRLGKVRELKPNNRKAIKRGEKQVEGYKQELEKLYPDKNWKSYVDTY